MFLKPGSHLTSFLIIGLKIKILSDWHTLHPMEIEYTISPRDNKKIKGCGKTNMAMVVSMVISNWRPQGSI